MMFSGVSFLDLLLAGDAGIVAQAVGDVLIGVQVREQRVVLEDDVEAALLHRHPGQVLAVEEDLTAGGVGDAEDDVQQRGLAAAGGAEDRHDPALVQGQADAVQHGGVAERLGDVLQFEHGSLLPSADGAKGVCPSAIWVPARSPAGFDVRLWGRTASVRNSIVTPVPRPMGHRGRKVGERNVNSG